jgi:hypothetical protein
MSWARITRTVVLLLVAIAIIYDIIVCAAVGTEVTISRIALSWSVDTPIVLLGIGVVIGHLFWSQPRPSRKNSGEGGSGPPNAEGENHLPH